MLLLQGRAAPQIPANFTWAKKPAVISQSFRAVPSVPLFWDRLLLKIPFSLIFAAPLVALAVILLICLFRRGSRDVLGFFLRICFSVGLSCGSGSWAGRISWCWQIDLCSSVLWIKLVWELCLVLLPIIPASSRILKRTNEFKPKAPPTTPFYLTSLMFN